MGGTANGGSGAAAFKIGGACVYPLGGGFNIYDNTRPQLTGINGLTRFCATGSEFTSYLNGLSGPGGFIKEGPDTLNIIGSEHSFSGPIIISNGTLNVNISMTGRNDVIVAGGSLNLNGDVWVVFNSLMVTGGVFQVSSNALLALSSDDPWVRVAGAGTLRLSESSTLLRLDISDSGTIDLSEGGTASVYRVRINGVELDPGCYTSANCEAIVGGGTLAVTLQRPGPCLSDTFSRADAEPAGDSLGQTEVGGADWAEFRTSSCIGDAASIVNGELRLGIGDSRPTMALTAASWPNGVFSTRMRFNHVGGAGAAIKNGCGLELRRSITKRTTGWGSIGWKGSVHVLVTPAGGLFLRENYIDNKYTRNPFSDSDQYLVYGEAGSLPQFINGLPFDANGDGRLGADEPFDLTAILSGSRLQVLINGEPVLAYSSLTPSDLKAENCAGLWNNRLAGGNSDAYDSYHDNFTVTNLPYFIRHMGSIDPNVDAVWPRENWSLGTLSDTNAVAVGAITETIGGEEVQAWSINDTSTDKLAHYLTPLTAAECADVNTNRWRFTMRLRVVNDNSPIAFAVAGQVATGSRITSVGYGSDASGNARVKVGNGATHTIPGGNMYHTYVLEHDPQTFTLSVSCDGALLESGIAWGSHTVRRILWGANSSAGMGHAHYQLVRFEFVPPPPPPPPGTLIILR